MSAQHGGAEFAAQTDAELLRLSAKRPAAFGELYDRHVDVIHGWFRARVESDAVGLDLTAETFARALAGAKRFRDEADGSALPWLFGIARNLLWKYERKRSVESSARRRIGMPVRAYEDEAFEKVIGRASASEESAVRAAVAALPVEQRDALELRVVDELTYEEVAARLAISEPAARKRVMRALRFLRARLHEVKE